MQATLDKLTARVSRTEERIAAINKQLDRFNYFIGAKNGDWSAVGVDPTVGVSPLPRGACSTGALEALKASAQPMDTNEIAAAILESYGLISVPERVFRAVHANVVQNMQALKKRGMVESDGARFGARWTRVPLADIRRQYDEKVMSETASRVWTNLKNPLSVSAVRASTTVQNRHEANVSQIKLFTQALCTDS